MSESTRLPASRWSTAKAEADLFDFIVRLQPERVRIELFGELDVATVPRLSRRIEGLLGRFEHLELDLTHVEFLGSAGITLIAGAARRVGAGGTVTLLHPRTDIRRILDAVTLPACVAIGAPDPAPPIDPGHRLHDQLASTITTRTTVQQAIGVLAEQGGLQLAEASKALRTYARNANLSLSGAASTIVTRQHPTD